MEAVLGHDGGLSERAETRKQGELGRSRQVREILGKRLPGGEGFAGTFLRITRMRRRGPEVGLGANRGERSNCVGNPDSRRASWKIPCVSGDEIGAISTSAGSDQGIRKLDAVKFSQ